MENPEEYLYQKHIVHTIILYTRNNYTKYETEILNALG